MLKSKIVLSLTGLLGAAGLLMADVTAPGFELPAVDGQTHSLAQYRGKIVVLEWTNYDCPFVKKFYAAGAMQALQKEFIDQGVVWLSICSSAPGKQGHFTVDEWKRRMQADDVRATAVLLDEDGKVGRAYDARTTPHMYIIDPDGKLVYRGAIDDQPSARPASLKDARNYVREVLQAMLAGNKPPIADTKPYGCSVKY